MTYLRQAFGTPAPQSEALPGREDEMVRNSAGGMVFAVDDSDRLRRFLVLGSEGGSYYAGERKLTLDNANTVKRCIAADGQRVIDEVVRASRGIAPRNGPSLFVLAMAASFSSDEVRRAAFYVLPEVDRTGSHLFQFVEYVDGMRGWGKGLRHAIGAWYEAQGTWPKQPTRWSSTASETVGPIETCCGKRTRRVESTPTMTPCTTLRVNQCPVGEAGHGGAG